MSFYRKRPKQSTLPWSRQNRGKRRPYQFEVLESRAMLAADLGLSSLHNSAYPKDVNLDNRVSPLDALVIINDLQVNGVHLAPATLLPLVAGGGGAAGTPRLDVNNDHVVSPLDLLQVVNSLAVEKLVRIQTFTTDLAGNPISTIAAGSQFRLRTQVQDIRNPPATFQGVFSAYTTVDYTASRTSIDPAATVSFDAFFPLTQTFDLSTAGKVIGAGAAASSSTAPGNAVQQLWNVVATATTSGLQTFIPSFDTALGHDTTLYGLNDPLVLEQIDFVGNTLQITGVPTLSIDDVSQLEGNSSTTPFVFTVTLSEPVNDPVTVGFSNTGITAAIPEDFLAISGTLTFAPGVTTRFITVQVVGETVPESDETFNVVLFPPVANAVLGKSIGLGTIQNDDVVPGTQRLSIDDVALAEGNTGTTPFVFTVTMSAPSNDPVTVMFNATGVTAVIPADFAPTSGTLTFAPGITTRFITVNVVGEGITEPDETFNVVLVPPATGAIIDKNIGVGTILNDDTLPTMTINSITLPEGNSGTTNFVFTASLSNPPSQNVIVRYATADGTATTANNDYVAQTGTITFTPAVTTQAITIVINGDTAVETSETFTVNLTAQGTSPGVVNVNAVGQGTIVNDDGAATVTINDVEIVSSPSQQVNAIFTVSLSAAITQQATVSFATANGTATAGDDYVAQSGILTFVPGGALSLPISVPILPHPTPGVNETFFVNLSSSATNITLSDPQGVGTIISQGVSIGSISTVEGNSGSTNAVIPVTLSQAPTTQVTVEFATSNGTATIADQDYFANTGTITFAPGDPVTKFITVVVLGDTKVESNENFTVTLSNPVGTTLFISTGTVTILNDDGERVQVRLQLANGAGSPLPDGTVLGVNDTFVLQAFVQDVQAVPNGVFQAYIDATFDASLVALDGPVTFGTNYPNGQFGSTSTPGLFDEFGAFGGLTPPALPGSEQLLFSAPFTVIDVGLANFIPSTADLPGRDILLYTSNTPVPASAIRFVGTSINIGENVFSVANATTVEGDAGQTSLVFTVTRFLPAATSASVEFNTGAGTATAGADYTSQSGTLSFAVGETSKTITVPIIGDLLDEEDETFFVSLSNAVGATASQSPGTGTILDNDGSPTASIADGTGSEGQNVNLVVTLSGPSGKTVFIPFASTASGSGNKATVGVDYQTVSGTLTFAPGVTQQTIAVPTLTDNTVEPTETFQVVLSDPTNTVLNRAQGQGNILDVPPAMIRGSVFIDSNGNGVRDGNEAGIPGVTITAVRPSDGFVPDPAVTATDGTYSFVGLPPGVYNITQVHPIFYLDGRDVHNGVESPINDGYNGVVVAASQVQDGYNFGEAGLRPEFITTEFDRRAFFSSSAITEKYGPPKIELLNLTEGETWIAFDAGWDGTKIIDATFSQGSATMTLYDFNLRPLASSTASATGTVLPFTSAAGNPYFLKVHGTSANVQLKVIDTVSVTHVTQAEGQSGLTSFVFTVSLSGSQSQSVAVQYFTSAGTALAGSDFQAALGILTFAPGEVTKAVTVSVVGDAAAEAVERFYLNLALETDSLSLGQSQGIGTILDDDGNAAISGRFSSNGLPGAPALGATDEALSQLGDLLS